MAYAPSISSNTPRINFYSMGVVIQAALITRLLHESLDQ